MATDLFDLVPALKRSVAVPGTFAALFPSSTDEDLALTLLDGFSEAQLDGFFPTYTSDDDGLVTEDLTRAQQALVVIYSTVRILQSEVRNRLTHKRYEAGGTVFEEDQGASTLVELLRDYKERKAALRAQGRSGPAGSAFWMADAYLMRAAGADVWN
jgi:hypothetical protein